MTTNEETTAGASTDQSAAQRLAPNQQRALGQAEKLWAVQYGAGSRLKLRQATLSMLGDPDSTADPYAQCAEVEQLHVLRFGRSALALELSDERQRDEARDNDTALVRYEAAWHRRLCRLQRSHPERWHVAGLSDEEVRDALTLYLLECVRSEPLNDAQYCRPAKPWGLLVLQDKLRSLRRSFRLGATPVDFREPPALVQAAESHEQRWLLAEAEACRIEAAQVAQQRLSSRQRQWLAAMRLAAVGGDFFQSSAALNLSAASRVLGKHRSSAQRAYKELQAQFRHALCEVE